MKMLRIVSQKAGFRRCGVAHPAEAVDHPMDRFSKKQIECLSSDPMLYVHEVDASDASSREPAKEAAAGARALADETARADAAEKALAGAQKAQADAEEKARTETARADGAEKALADAKKAEGRPGDKDKGKK